VYQPDQPSGAEYARYARESLLAGDEIDGPAVISEHTATTVIHAGDRLRVGGRGELIITVRAEQRG
jgi:N-methylhydantoinase A